MDTLTEQNQNPRGCSDEEDYYELSLLDLLVILVQQRKFIIKTTVLVAVLAIAYALLATPIYKSSLQIMPPSGDKSNSAVASALAAGGFGDILNAGLLSTTADTVVEIVKSPAVADKVIDANNLLTRQPDGWSLSKLFSFGSKGDAPAKPASRSKVRMALSSALNCTVDKKGSVINLSVADSSPDMAVQLAQSFFDQTILVLRNVALSPAAQQRLFLEEQLKKGSQELSKAKEALVAFQNKTGLVGDNGVSTSIAALASLQAQILVKERELHAAQRFAGPQNPKVRQLQTEYDTLKSQLAGDWKDRSPSPLATLGADKLAQASAEYATLIREYKLRESIIQILEKQYETVKIKEANEAMVIQLLSPPTYPEQRESPKRGRIVIIATFLGGFLGVFMAFIRHFIAFSSQDPQSAPKMAYIADALASDFSFLKRIKKNKKK